jgi:zinc transporter ZupT
MKFHKKFQILQFLYIGATILQTVFLNFISALAAFLGALLTFYFHNPFSNKVNFIAALTAGGFIYLGASMLVPEIHKNNRF